MDDSKLHKKATDDSKLHKKATDDSWMNGLVMKNP